MPHPGAHTIKINWEGGVPRKAHTYLQAHLPYCFVFQELAVLVCGTQTQLIRIKFHLVGKQKPQLQERPSVKHQFPEGCGQLSALTVVEQSAAPTGSGPLGYF